MSRARKTEETRKINLSPFLFQSVPFYSFFFYTAWRVFGALGKDELTYTFPYAKLKEIADQIKPTAEYVNNLYTSLLEQ